MCKIPYRKALTAHHFFKKIKLITVNSTFSHEYLISIMASYFEFETRSTDIQSEAAVLVNQCEFFHVDNQVSIGFIDSRIKLVLIDQQNPLPGVTYFLFRSTVNDASIDKRGPNRSLFVNFVLRLPQTLVSRFSGIDLLSIMPTAASLDIPTQKNSLSYENEYTVQILKSVL